MITHASGRRPFPAAGLGALALSCGLVFAAGARLEVYFASDLKDPAYQQKVHQKVGAVWKRPTQNPRSGGKAVVITNILRDGSAPEPRVHHASGSEAWDAAALQAVKAAAPFPPLPGSYKPASVEVHFHFEFAE